MNGIIQGSLTRTKMIFFFFLLEKEVAGGFEWFTKYETNRTQGERINMKYSVAQSSSCVFSCFCSSLFYAVANGIRARASYHTGDSFSFLWKKSQETVHQWQSGKFLGRPAASISYLDDFGQCLFPDLRHRGCSSPVCPHTLPCLLLLSPSHLHECGDYQVRRGGHSVSFSFNGRCNQSPSAHSNKVTVMRDRSYGRLISSFIFHCLAN